MLYIVGVDAGGGIMQLTDKAIVEEYGLDLDLKASSGPVMTATLQGAIERGEWVVVTGWNPHWKFARWDSSSWTTLKRSTAKRNRAWRWGTPGSVSGFRT